MTGRQVCSSFLGELQPCPAIFLSADFLHRMRDYMPPSHRAFHSEEICGALPRPNALSSGNGQLPRPITSVWRAWQPYDLPPGLRTKYLITAPSKAKARRTSHLPRPPRPSRRGAPGSAVMSFLKSGQGQDAGGPAPPKRLRDRLLSGNETQQFRGLSLSSSCWTRADLENGLFCLE